MQQLALFDTNYLTNFEFPDYKKVYTVFAYDEIKTHQFYKKKKAEAKRKKDPGIYNNLNPYEVAKQFAIYNKDGTIKLLGDQRHIYRIAALHRIYEEIGKRLIKGIYFDYYQDNTFYVSGVKIYYDYYDKRSYKYKTVRDGWRNFKQEESCHIAAEIDKTQELSIKNKLKIHIKLLRELRKGLNAQEAMEEVRKWLMKN